MRLATVSALFRPGGEDLHRPKGEPLSVVCDHVQRYYYAQPSLSGSRRDTVRRVCEVAASILPPYPSPLDIMAWQEHLRTMLGTDGTVNLYMRTMAAVYGYGGKLGLVQGNPFALVPLRRPSPTPTPILDITAIWLGLIEACRDARERGALALARHLGLRRGEILALTKDDFDTYAEPWRVEVTKQRANPNTWVVTPRTKSGSRAGQRDLPVLPDLKPFIAEVLSLPPAQVKVGRGGQRVVEVPFLFPFREHDLSSKRGHGNGLVDRWRRAAPDAFPPGHAWHALRDTLAVELMRAKGIGAARDVLGHDTERVTRDHYLGHHGKRVEADGLIEAAKRRAAAEKRSGGGAPCSTPPPGPEISRPQLSHKEKPTCGTHPNTERAVSPEAPTKVTTRKASSASRGSQRALPNMLTVAQPRPPKQGTPRRR